MIQIHIGSATYTYPVENASYRYRTIMGENELTLYFASVTFVATPLGAYCDFEGERYTLMIPENFKKLGDRNFEYVMIMNSAQSLLGKYKYRDTGSNRLKFTVTDKPLKHLQMLVDNLNQRDAGWTVGTCLNATEKTISYNHQYCKEALQSIAEAFETEWEVVGKTINLNKIEYNRATPLALSYGMGNGLKPGVGRTNVDASNPMEILFVQGGERNIDESLYGSAELRLPLNKQITYEGREYTTDAAGLFITRTDKAPVTETESSLDLSNIYPSRVGTISSVIVVDLVNNKYDFIDNTIPASLDYTACLIKGKTMSVIFQTGMLTGKEFDVKYIHATRKFQMVATQMDGQTMPNETYKPRAASEGVEPDTYIVYGISLPTAYVCDDPTQTGASWDLFREAVKYMFENEDPRFNFTGELDGIWAKANWGTIGPKIKLGGMVLFSDPHFEIEGELIRIVGIKDLVNDPSTPEIELSNMPIVGSLMSDIRKIQENEVTLITTVRGINDSINRRRRKIVSTRDDMLNADDLVRTADITPRMLAPDAGTPQFSIERALVEPTEGNTIRLTAGELVNHNYYALDKSKIISME